MAFSILMLNPQGGYTQNPENSYSVSTFDVSGDVSLEVRTSGGRIDVEGVSGNEVRVEMYVQQRGRYMQQGEIDLDDYDINISQDGNYVTAEVKRDNNRWWGNKNISISFKVYTPRNTRTRLRTSGGQVDAANMIGSQELRTSGGRINVDNITGQVVLKTSGGSVSLEDVEGDVDAHTSGGRIKALNILGNTELRTSGGSIEADGIRGNLDARTSGGSINATVLDPMDFIELRTSGGSITITVPEGRGYNLDLDGNRVRAELKNFSGEYDRDKVEGTLNGGGALIEARTSGGSVTLRYMDAI